MSYGVDDDDDDGIIINGWWDTESTFYRMSVCLMKTIDLRNWHKA